MHLVNFVLELADGSRVQLERSQYSNSPVVMKADVPGQLKAFSADNPPKGSDANADKRNIVAK